MMIEIGFLSLFEVDLETLMYTQESVDLLVGIFGLITFEEAVVLIPGISAEIFYGLGCQNLKIAVGLGITDWETLTYVMNAYAEMLFAA